MNYDHGAIAESVLSLHREGRITRGEWSGESNGRKTACLWYAIAQAAGLGEAAWKRPAECPSALMPVWLAECLPGIDDCGSDAVWPGMVERFGGLVAGFGRLDDAAWERVRVEWLVSVIEEAMSHLPADAAIRDRVLSAYRGVIAALRGEGDLAAAETAARAAAEAAAAAGEAAEAAEAAGEAEVAWAAAWAAARAAPRAASRAAAAAAEAAAWAAARAARAAAATRAAAAARDRMTARLMDLIEAEIQKTGGAA